MKINIIPSELAGSVKAPPSKSYAHRYLIAAALAEGESTVEGVEMSGDIASTEACLSALGASLIRRGDRITVYGGGKLKENAVFPCGESASTLRFLLPLALLHENRAVFSAEPRLLERGIGVYEKLFAEKGVKVEKTPSAITVKGRLCPGDYRVAGNVSSQYISGLLFTLPLLDGESRLTVLPPVESKPYIGMTLDVLYKAGIEIRKESGNCFRIPGGQRYHPIREKTEGDWSGAAVFYALNDLGHKINVTGLSENSLQGDRAIVSLLCALKKPSPVIELADTPDLAPILFAAAAAGNGAVFTGTGRLKLKESDRAAVMAEELAKCGVKVKMEENRMTVFGGTLCKPKETLSSHHDHRIAMALSILLTKVGGEIQGTEAVGKSWPGYWDALCALGCRMKIET